MLKWQTNHFNKLTNEQYLQWFALVKMISQAEADDPYWLRKDYFKGLDEEASNKKLDEQKKDIEQKKKDFVPLWDKFNKSM